MHNYSKDMLEQVTKDHPYFSAAQFYLLQKTEPTAATYARQAAKTAIFFNNPYWLNFQLQQAPATNDEIKIIPLPEILTEEDINNNEVEMEEKEPASAPEPRLAEMVIEDDEPMEKEIEPMKLDLKMPPESSKTDELIFEPMHLVDYFASQGIKLNEDVQQGDKLGKQLKSFTEWLKTMKKVHIGEEGLVNQPAAAITGPADASIQNLAEKSNAGDEILTEAMAEVLAKQGKQEKAVELYQKLSLLNPSKSAYFAAKIENLNGL